MANKQRYTVERVVEALEHARGMKGHAARMLGCSYQTITNYEKRSVRVRETIREQREMMVDVAELSLYGAVGRGEPWAVCFFLKTQAKHRGYVEKAQVHVLVEQEFEAMLSLLEDNLDPREFRKVLGILASAGAGGT